MNSYSWFLFWISQSVSFGQGNSRARMHFQLFYFGCRCERNLHENVVEACGVCILTFYVPNFKILALFHRRTIWYPGFPRASHQIHFCLVFAFRSIPALHWRWLFLCDVLFLPKIVFSVSFSGALIWRSMHSGFAMPMVKSIKMLFKNFPISDFLQYILLWTKTEKQKYWNKDFKIFQFFVFNFIFVHLIS